MIESEKEVNYLKPRHELKHELNYLDYQIIKSRLKAVLTMDSHADTTGSYFIRSLYFDTPNDTALMEKINGVNHREKFRIRYYNYYESKIFLEKKSKHNSLCYKESTLITKKQVVAILNGDLKQIVASDNKLLRELLMKMKNTGLAPKTIVDYDREPFISPAGNVRITFDRNIRTALSSTDFFNRELATIPVPESPLLMEVKYDGFLPEHIRRLIQVGNRRATAFSKYAVCRSYD